MNTDPLPLDLEKWIHHFGTANRRRRPEPDWDRPLDLPERKRRALAATLAQFQLGDGGGPCRLIARDAERLRGSGGSVRRVIDLWFAEEAEHSRLLSGAVRRLGGTPVTDGISFRLFNRCRRVSGAQFEMLVLLIVEIVSTAYYRLVREHCGDEPVRQMCRLILRDEAGHVTFHRERLAGRHPGGPPLWWTGCFFALGAACTGFLWLSHGRWLRPLGGSARQLASMSGRGLIQFRRRLGRGPSGSETHLRTAVGGPGERSPREFLASPPETALLRAQPTSPPCRPHPRPSSVSFPPAGDRPVSPASPCIPSPENP